MFSLTWWNSQIRSCTGGKESNDNRRMILILGNGNLYSRKVEPSGEHPGCPRNSMNSMMGVCECMCGRDGHREIVKYL